MNAKFWITGVVLFIVKSVFGFLIHGLLLHPEYIELSAIMRTGPDAGAHFPYIILADAIFSFAVAWIYQQGVKPGASWLSQGLRFGIALALITPLYMYLVYYAVEPMPAMLVAKQIAFDGAVCVILGLLAAFLNKPAAG